MKKQFRGWSLFLLLVIGLTLITTLFQGGFAAPAGRQETINYNREFLASVANDQVYKVSVLDNQLTGLYRDTAVRERDFPKDYDFKVTIPSSEQFYRDVLTASGLSPDASTSELKFEIVLRQPESNLWLSLLPYGIMLLLFVGTIWLFFSRQQAGGSGAMTFGKSRARLYNEDKRRVSFADVAGADEEKAELAEIVDFLKSPRKFTELGARIPKGILLVGPPGTGKTYLAKAVAGEAGVPFFSISGSDFVELFVGVGASRVRDLFEQAKKNMPCIVFIDEIDAVGRQRGAGMGGGHDEREQTLNQLLVEMDGFSLNEGIIIIAATNRPDILDPALLRPGRFDRQIYVSHPDVRGREAVLKVHSRQKPMDKDVDLEEVAKITPYFTPADLENVLNEAAILTARRNKQKIGMDEIREAISRVELGPEKKSRVVTEKDKKLVAYHEAGHALVAYMLPHCDVVNEISIIPRGQAGGYTATRPDEESYYVSKAKLMDRIAMSMGGHAAEKMMLNDVSTGSTGDLKTASDMARRMVTQYGMSEQLGPVYLGGDHEVFLGRDFASQQNYSDELAAAIDREIRRILDTAYERASTIISENRDKLHRVADALLKREKLNRAEFEQVLLVQEA